MRLQLRTRAIPAIALAVGIGVLAILDRGSAADASRQVLPDDDYPQLVKHLVKGITDALKGSPDDLRITKAHTAAVMVAACAQQNLDGAEGQQRATVRDAALKLADTIQAKKFTDALKQAKALATLPADPKAKKEKVKLIDAKVPYRDLMNQFNHPPEGGWGIDRKLYAYRLSMKAKIPPEDLKAPLLMLAYQVAVTAEMVNTKVPKMKQKEWDTFSGDLMRGAVQLAEAVKKQDGTSGLDAVAKMTTSCSNCHKIFRGK